MFIQWLYCPFASKVLHPALLGKSELNLDRAYDLEHQRRWEVVEQQGQAKSRADVWNDHNAE